METYFSIKRALFVLCLLAMPALAGCQTTAGFGRDVQATGRWIEGGAQDTQAWMFGSPAQAAETPARATETSAQMAETGNPGNTPGQAMTPAARTLAAHDNVVYFTTGSADIPADARQMIRTIADDSKQGTHKIEVVGYTDTAGSAEHNKQLSQRRAEAVADELVTQGVRRESIDVQWHGENELPVPTGDDVHEPQNRCVSIAMVGG
jgi:outer membrane protein OmpA-like peptidoglycan-associated protein